MVKRQTSQRITFWTTLSKDPEGPGLEPKNLYNPPGGHLGAFPMRGVHKHGSGGTCGSAKRVPRWGRGGMERRWCCQREVVLERLGDEPFFHFHLRAPRGTEPHVALSLQSNLLGLRSGLVVNLYAELLPWQKPSLCDARKGRL